jgi:hypothetical protein
MTIEGTVSTKGPLKDDFIKTLIKPPKDKHFLSPFELKMKAKKKEKTGGGRKSKRNIKMARKFRKRRTRKKRGGQKITDDEISKAYINGALSGCYAHVEKRLKENNISSAIMTRKFKNKCCKVGGEGKNCWDKVGMDMCAMDEGTWSTEKGKCEGASGGRRRRKRRKSRKKRRKSRRKSRKRRSRRRRRKKR